jgi:O-antigen/teichoic acid export membrane protein
VSAVVVVRLLGIETYGRLQAVVVTASLLSIVLDIGRTSGALARVGGVLTRTAYNAEFFPRQWTTLAVGALTGCFIALGAPSAVVAVALFIACNLATVRWGTMIVGRPLAVFTSFAIRPVATASGAVLAMRLHIDPVVAISTAAFAGGVLTGAIDYLVMRRSLPLGEAGTATTWRERVGLVVTACLTHAYTTGDLLIVAALAGPMQAGIYAVAYRPNTPIVLILGFVRDSWTVDEAISSERRAGFRRTMASVAVAAAACAAGMIILKPLSKVFAVAETADVVSAILILSLVPIVATAHVQASLIARGQMQLAMPVAVASLALSVSLNLVLVPLFGALGASGTTLLVETLCASYYLLKLRHRPQNGRGTS